MDIATMVHVFAVRTSVALIAQFLCALITVLRMVCAWMALAGVNLDGVVMIVASVSDCSI
jgi:hypothetical protein